MPSQRRIRVIVNPSAKRGRGPVALGRAGILATPPAGVRLEWVTSRSAEHLKELVVAAAGDDLHAVAVAGGDGTVALAIGALSCNSIVPLGILPVGSGNDFAADIGVPRSLPEAFSLLVHGAPRLVDVGLAGAFGDRYCCVASVGLDELALRTIHGSKLPRSKALNIYASLRALVEYRPRRARITWQGGAFEDEIMFAAVTNTRSYGGGFLVSPEARVDDGVLNLCVFRRAPRTRLLGQFPRILRGTHGALPEVILAATPWVRIEGDAGELPVALDGELPRLTTPIELRCDPRRLLVIAPDLPPNARATGAEASRWAA